MTGKGQRSRKRNKPQSDISDCSQIFGIFKIIPNYEPYNISERNKEKLKKVFLINNGVHAIEDEEVAKDELLMRDHEKIYKMSSRKFMPGNLGLVKIPSTFISSVPTIFKADEQEYTKKLRSDGKNHDFIAGKIGNLVGDIAEREVFEHLQKYLSKKGHDCLLVHGHSFLHFENYEQKDFIIVNITLGYILVLETKTTNNKNLFSKGRVQLQDAKFRMQKLFDSIPGMSSKWTYVNLLYFHIWNENDFRHCQNDHTFIVRGQYEIEAKLEWLENQLQSDWKPKEHVAEFKSIVKQLLYEAQGHPNAPVSLVKEIEMVSQTMDKTCKALNIFFWTPEQLSVINAMNTRFMALLAYFGCGKTILLKERVNFLLENSDGAQIHFFIHKNFDFDNDSVLLEALKKDFQGKGIEPKLFPYDGTFTVDDLVKNGVKKGDHVVIDEAFDFGNENDINNLRGYLGSLWISFGPLKNSAIKLQGFRRLLEKCEFACPIMKFCLRNTKKILNETKRLPFSNPLYNELAIELEDNCNMNDGTFEECPIYHDDPLIALHSAMERIPMARRSLIVFNRRVSIPALQTKFSTMKFSIASDPIQLQDWFSDEDQNEIHHLVHCSNIYDATYESTAYLRGAEFDVVFNVSMGCRSCIKLQNTCDGLGIIYSRAKVALIEVRQTKCRKCKEDYEQKEMESKLHSAATNGQLQIVKRAARFLDDMNSLCNGLMPIHSAAKGGHVDIIEYLLLFNENEINPPDEEGWTVLHHAANCGNLNVFQFYQGKLNDLNDLNPHDECYGQTPLHLASQEGHLGLVDFICNQIDDKNPRDNNGVLPVHKAAEEGRNNIIEYFIQFNQNNINPADINGWTVLHHAAFQGHLNVFQFYHGKVNHLNPKQISVDHITGWLVNRGTLFNVNIIVMLRENPNFIVSIE